MSKKTEKTKKTRKKIIKKTKPWKKPIKPIKILKKPTGSVWFRFYKLKTEKTEPNRTQTEPNRKNQLKPVWTNFCPKKPNRTETSRFESVSIRFRFLKKNQFGYFFFYKNQTEPKIITQKNHFIEIV